MKLFPEIIILPIFLCEDHIGTTIDTPLGWIRITSVYSQNQIGIRFIGTQSPEITRENWDEVEKNLIEIIENYFGINDRCTNLEEKHIDQWDIV